jgi:UDP-N-acetylglucosamine/UDP-N-acetylgalactosamine diphosphorylase
MMQDAFDSLKPLLEKHGQSHLIGHWNSLNPVERELLVKDIQSIDFDELRRLFLGNDKGTDWKQLASHSKPPDAVRLEEVAAYRHAKTIGEDALRAGKVAMILVAGGQGTRLGFDLPKGMFRIGPVSNRTLFAMHVDSLRGAMKKYEVEIPLLIMTSPATDQQTKEFFTAHNNLGLRNDQITIFQQGTMPAIDASNGAVLLESTHRIAMSPDGHGGIVKALSQHGLLHTCSERGIEHFFYAQVDNPLVTACDPTLIGHHLHRGSQMTTQVVQKRFAKEKVGNVVSIDGKTQIIEYSDLPDEVAELQNPDGSLKLWAGNIAVHVLDRQFLENCCLDDNALPFHRASKAVSFVDTSGSTIKPASPNAIKFERFVFDLLPRAARALVVEGDAAEVFAPVKNAEGAATDTPSFSRLAISNRFKRWLAAAGVESDDACFVEINPLWALDAEDVKTKIQSPSKIQSNTYFA